MPLRPTQLGRFRKALGEEGVEELLVRTMEVAVTLKLIAKKELTRVIVDSTVQEKAVAHPTDSKLLETARSKLVEAPRPMASSSSKPTPKRANCWAARLGATPTPASSSACAKSSNASAPSSGGCSAKWVAR